ASLALRTSPPPAVPTRNDPPAPPPPPDPRNSVNPHIVIGAGTIAALGGVISAIMSGVQTIEPDQAQDAAVQCVRLVQYAIDHEAFAASQFTQHPCVGMPVFFPGSTPYSRTQNPPITSPTTFHDWNAILGHPAWLKLNWVTHDDRIDSGLVEKWYNGDPDCT